MIIINCTSGTQFNEKIYDLIKDHFGKVVEAKMHRTENSPAGSVLTLINYRGEELIFKDCFTAGYGGEGANGTFRVLLTAGFKIGFDYIENNPEFTLLNQ